jgi:(p)ppGpp synthase/HD superfamily hydrolase
MQSAGRGIDIHTIDCEELAKTEAQQELWLDLGWRRAAEQTASTGRVTATVEHVPGALADVTKIIGESGGNLTNIKTLRRSPTFFDMVLDIEVRDNRHLVQIIAALRASIYVVSTERSRADFNSEEDD